jgi:hypothetical protein
MASSVRREQCSAARIAGATSASNEFKARPTTGRFFMTSPGI